jgi:integrase
MARKRSRASTRQRIGKVSLYQHHGCWWVYYRDSGKSVRKRFGPDRSAAEKAAAQINHQVAANEPTLLSFVPIEVAELRKRFLEYHENILQSSLGTVERYRTVTLHLIRFVEQHCPNAKAHEINPEQFVGFLRNQRVASNGRKAAPQRRMSGKGLSFTLQTCRTMFNYGLKRRHFPPYVGNPFAELPVDRMKIEDAKPIFVLTEALEYQCLANACEWAFPFHFLAAKTGLRVGELGHLLIEDLDLEKGWLRITNKLDLGWRIKTGQERVIPLLPEVVAVLRRVIARRTGGPVFLRQKYIPINTGFSAASMKSDIHSILSGGGVALNRKMEAQITQKVWQKAGYLKNDLIRRSFIHLMRMIGCPESTCAKSWRHTFATLLQDSNVDPLIRQQVMGHSPSVKSSLGMTVKYTHTRPETLRKQVEGALRAWPRSLELAREWASRKEYPSFGKG